MEKIMKTILVTGVAGFIGSNFVKYFADRYPKYRIVGLDKLTYAGNIKNIEEDMKRDNFMFVKGDICDESVVERIFADNDITGVINFAAESHVDRSISGPQIFLKTNILGTQVLLEAAKKAWCKEGIWKKGCKFLQISTDEVYGSLGEEGLFSEDTPLDPRSPYSASKAAADLLVNAYKETYGMPVNITRCSNNYGPYQFPEKLIPLTIMNAMHHKKIPVYGDGKQIRDWIHVNDHCIAIDRVFHDARLGEVYNIGGNCEKRNIQIVKKILDILSKNTGDKNIGHNLISYVKDRPGHDRRYAMDISKMKKELGWQPDTSFDKGIEDTIVWYIKNQGWIEDIISR